MATLSSTVNTLSVLGTADIVVRLSVRIIDLYRKSQDASEQILRLLSDLKDLNGVVAHIRTFIEDFEASDFATNDFRTLPHDLVDILRDCQRELIEVERIALQYKTDDSDSWMRKWCKNVGFGFGAGFGAGDKIQTSCRRIEGYKCLLNGLLSLIGRTNDNAIRREIGSTRNEIVAASTAADVASNTIQQELRQTTQVAAHAIHMQSVRTSAMIASGNRANATSFDALQGTLSSGHSKLEEICDSLDLINRNIQGPYTRVCSEIQKRPSCGALQRAQSRSSKARSRGRAYGSKLESQPLAVDIWCSTDGEVLFGAESPETIALPLMLLSNELLRIGKNLKSRGNLKLALSEVAWIEGRLNNLLAIGHHMAAMAASERAALPEGAPLIKNFITSGEGELSELKLGSVTSVQDQKSLEHYIPVPHERESTYEFSTKVGMLQIERGRICRSPSPEKVEVSPRSYRLNFVPDKAILCGKSIDLTLSHLQRVQP